jgi:hypothetical protein
MNNDLAWDSAVRRVLHGVRGSPLLLLDLCTCHLVFKKPPKMVLRRMMGPTLETGAVLDSATDQGGPGVLVLQEILGGAKQESLRVKFDLTTQKDERETKSP